MKDENKKDDEISVWVKKLVERSGKKKDKVELEKKIERIGWAIITSGKPYEENYAV